MQVNIHTYSGMQQICIALYRFLAFSIIDNVFLLFFFQAAILQQTTDFIRNMQQEKAKIHAQNAYYKRLLSEVSRRCNIDLEMDISLCGGSPPLKRKKRDTGMLFFVKVNFHFTFK